MAHNLTQHRNIPNPQTVKSGNMSTQSQPLSTLKVLSGRTIGQKILNDFYVAIFYCILRDTHYES